MNIDIRNIDNVKELLEVKALESMIWAMDDPVPVHHMAAVINSGGLVLGAFLNERLIGFQYSFPGSTFVIKTAKNNNGYLIPKEK